MLIKSGLSTDFYGVFDASPAMWVKADSRQEVDRAYEELVKIGADIVSEPKIHPEYSENYYAVYFKDLENIKYEIVCTKA